jgi:4-amino-4-deoxy-L-arabinose transferase-like glycosyltransferase
MPSAEAAALPRRRALSPVIVVGALVLAALVIRLAFVVALPGDLELRDAADYDRHAISIAQGDGYPTAAAPDRPTAYRPPGYPFFLAGVYLLAGVSDASADHRLAAGRIAQALLGTAIVALCALLAWRLLRDRPRVPVAAAALAAVWLPLILVGSVIASEPLFTLLVLAAVVAALEHRRGGHALRWAALAGVFAGLAALTRSNGIVIVGPLMLAVWTGRPWLSARALVAPAVVAVAAALVVTPWLVRNAIVFDAFIPIANQTGAALAGTYNDAARADRRYPGAWRVLNDVPDYYDIYRHKPRVPEPVLDRQLRDAALRYAADHPGYVVEVAARNTLRMVDLAGLDSTRRTAVAIGIRREWVTASVVWCWAALVLALTGVLALRGRAGPWAVWAVPALLVLSVVFLNVESPRFRTPIEPFLIVPAAAAVAALATAARTRRE